MGKVRITCQQWNCDGVVIEEGTPIPINHLNEDGDPCKGPLLDQVVPLSDDEDSDEDSPYQSPDRDRSPRPAWYPGRRRELKQRASSPGRTLYCRICGNEIEVNAQGKEEWFSKSGKKHMTSPHVDHFGTNPIGTDITGGVKGVRGDWIERKSALRGSRIHMAKSTPDRKRIERDVYNASPLRTTHMKCNCSRKKAHK